MLTSPSWPLLNRKLERSEVASQSSRVFLRKENYWEMKKEKKKKITRELCEGLFQNTALDNDHDSK